MLTCIHSNKSEDPVGWCYFVRELDAAFLQEQALAQHALSSCHCWLVTGNFSKLNHSEFFFTSYTWSQQDRLEMSVRP